MISVRKLLIVPGAFALGILSSALSLFGRGLDRILFEFFGAEMPTGLWLMGLFLGCAFAQALISAAEQTQSAEDAKTEKFRFTVVAVIFAAFYVAVQDWAWRTWADSGSTEVVEPMPIWIGKSILTITILGGALAASTLLLVTSKPHTVRRFIFLLVFGCALVVGWFLLFHSIDDLLRTEPHIDQSAFNWHLCATTTFLTIIFLVPCWLAAITFAALWPFKANSALTKSSGMAMASFDGGTR